jgi:chaperone required for assembly of F1-ATPase
MAEKFKPYRLPNELLAELRQERKNLVEGMKEIEAAEDCGIDCAIHREQYGQTIARIDKLIENFGPPVKFKAE